MSKLAYSVAEAAVALGLSKSEVYNLIADGTLTAKLAKPRTDVNPRGGKRMIPTAVLVAYLDERPSA